MTVVTAAPLEGEALSADPHDFVGALLARRLPEALWEPDDDVHASGPFDWPVRRAWAPGAVLVGDAAGYFDPFTGQGVYRALRSAELAAEAVDEALGRGSWEPLRSITAAGTPRPGGGGGSSEASRPSWPVRGSGAPCSGGSGPPGGSPRSSASPETRAPVGTLLRPSVWI